MRSIAPRLARASSSTRPHCRPFGPRLSNGRVQYSQTSGPAFPFFCFAENPPRVSSPGHLSILADALEVSCRCRKRGKRHGRPRTERTAQGKRKPERGGMKVGRLRIVTRPGLRGPGGQEAKERGTRRSSPKREKRYLAVCDSNNESKPPVKSVRQTSYRGNVNAIPVSTIPGPSCSISSQNAVDRLAPCLGTVCHSRA